MQPGNFLGWGEALYSHRSTVVRRWSSVLRDLVTAEPHKLDGLSNLQTRNSKLSTCVSLRRPREPPLQWVRRHAARKITTTYIWLHSLKFLNALCSSKDYWGVWTILASHANRKHDNRNTVVAVLQKLSVAADLRLNSGGWQSMPKPDRRRLNRLLRKTPWDIGKLLTIQCLKPRDSATAV